MSYWDFAIQMPALITVHFLHELTFCAWDYNKNLTLNYLEPAGMLSYSILLSTLRVSEEQKREIKLWCEEINNVLLWLSVHSDAVSPHQLITLNKHMNVSQLRERK